MHLKTISLISICSLITACGGGGSSSTTPDNSNSGTNTSNTLSLVAKYKDACGNEVLASDAALLIHNEDYSNKEIITADQNGKLTYQSTNSTQTISIVMPGQNKVGNITPINIATFIDYPIKDMGEFIDYTYETDACSCQTFNLQVSTPARANDIGQGKIFGIEGAANISSYRGQNHFDNFMVCKKQSGDWPLVSTIINFDSPSESFAAYIPDIANTTVINAENQGKIVDISTNDYSANKRVTTVINELNSLRSYTFDSSQNVYAFEHSDVKYYDVSAYTVDFMYQFPEVDEAVFIKSSTNNTTDIDKSFDLPIPDIAADKLLDILISDSGHYDLSQSASLDYMAVGLNALSAGEDILNWTVIAPASGQVPQIENIDISNFISDSALESATDEIELTAITKSLSGIDGYQDYLSSRASLPILEFTKEKAKASESAFLSITLNNASLQGLSNLPNSSQKIKAYAANKFLITANN
ncbi:hypothetical protein [Litorilituus sediminis]|uniref:Lipoprotein n=1 Tax=Litorilituus sediminis TaxID=718192 RepID=A0A4P6P4Q5_9GAMM|nr:hypothetical protein [Litorilituus sediminis]QBG36443.1 hypothetical protein EMK97_12305 [Litorilituus sediminis]